MRLLTLPGVFRPRSDSWMLAAHLRGQLRPGAAVLDVCTGSGLLAVTAARHGAGSATAIDVSRRAVLTAR
ncbi:MAG: release factor glutamine methyltransferase, partial [Solirubrobacteraceae bacterium]|nr:release factor glutamine methyltransferase [Solirubrobacteraceae bacterium]